MLEKLMNLGESMSRNMQRRKWKKNWMVLVKQEKNMQRLEKSQTENDTVGGSPVMQDFDHILKVYALRQVFKDSEVAAVFQDF